MLHVFNEFLIYFRFLVRFILANSRSVVFSLSILLSLDYILLISVRILAPLITLAAFVHSVVLSTGYLLLLPRIAF